MVNFSLKTSLLAVVFILILTLQYTGGASAQQMRTADIDEILFIHYLDEQVAVKEVQAGNLHAYYWRVPLELAQDLKTDQKVTVYEAPGGMMSLLVNPAPTEKGFNPFTLRNVRFALNYLIDRDFIVNEILRGFGAPQVAVYGVYDPDYLVIADEVETLGIKYNPTVAERMINEAMRNAGAVKVDGKWMVNNQPVVIKFFIRSDDPRRRAMGDALSASLEKVGFTVEKIFGDLTKTFDVVYGSDPKAGGWHLYTEGWGRSGFTRYDTATIAQMYAPWFSFMPGFGEATYWNYENKKLDDLTKRVTTGNFTSQAERDSLIKQATMEGVSESVRIFVVNLIEPYVVNKAMKGTVNDFGAGITTRWTPINARLDASGPLKIGMKQIYQGSWNPVAGFTDFYSGRIWQAVEDPGTWTHPHTGKIIPVRTTWQVETAGPTGKLPVPADTLRWDAVEHVWKKADAGTTATSKVTYKLKLGNWHHGQPMTTADFLYGVYFSYEWGTQTGDDDPTFDPEYTKRAEPQVKTLKGYRFPSNDVAESYVDYWHFDPDYIADYGSVWATTPWEIMAAMEKLVLDKKFAYSTSASKARGVDWISIIIRSNADQIKAVLDDWKAKRVVPKPLVGYVTPEEAVKRYEASIQWITKYGHAVISNGPYYVEQYNPDARVIRIKASNDPTYPFPTGAWRVFESSKVAEISNIEVPRMVEIGRSYALKVNVKVGGTPSDDVAVNYMIVNPRGEVASKGLASTTSTPGVLQIPLSPQVTGKFIVGPHTLRVFAVSNQAIKPDILQTSFIVTEPVVERTPTPAPMPPPPSSPTPAAPPASPKPSAPPQTIGTMELAIVVVGIVIVAAVVGTAYIRFRKHGK